MTVSLKTTSGGRLVLVAMIAAPLLAGCGESTKRALGWEKETPDEFTVVTRAPLTQPPDYSLRPPTPGSVRPQEGSNIDQARKALIGTSTSGGAKTLTPTNPELVGLSSGELSLLKKSN